MQHVIPVLVVLLVTLGILALRLPKYDSREQRLLLFAFFGHVISAWVQVWVTEDYYGGGDMLNYQQSGNDIARVLDMDFGGMAIENVKLFLHMENALPVDAFAAGSSSGTMCAVAGFLLFALGGSLYAACMAITMMAFFGNLALYHVFRDNFAPALRPRLLIGTMLVPSVVFWSSGVLKESIAIGGMGWMLFGVHLFLRERITLGVALFAVGGLLVGVTKAYILFPFVIAVAAWIFWEKAGRTQGLETIVVRPIYLGVAALIAAGAISLLGQAFPEFAVDRLAEETARYQELGRQSVSSSSYEMGDPTQRSVLGQLAFVPFALVSSLFRPFFFEVRNSLMFVSAVEMTILLVVFIRTVWIRSWRATLAQIRTSPLLMFSSVFTLLFAIAVGLASTNLGTLARYRMPLMPFYVSLIIVLSAPRELVEEKGEEEEDSEEDEASDSGEAVAGFARPSQSIDRFPAADGS